ncbi:hypothetical protein [Virgibacillus siamensis]|uniref:hypothetical protein n=1 Tax=Virgibacillus siamensis TaxID=480071 RepID=UPI000987496A|nr:hypothetical protein [Virgibacillus siamensis]
MNKIFFVMLATLVLVTAGCGSGGEDQAKNEQNQTGTEEAKDTGQTDKGGSSGLTSGVTDVQKSLDELKMVMQNNPDKTKKIQKIGKEAGEDWDEIEKQVEEKYPKAYENIEKSLYPLKAATKKDMPDKGKVKQLTSETLKKLQDFKKGLEK